jgi:methylenetetrahydrofolate reductase (NADPH)
MATDGSHGWGHVAEASLLSRAECTEATPENWLAGYSLEITAKEAQYLERARRFIPPGTRVSIPYLAAQERDERIRAAMAIKRTGFIPVPHISARRLASERALHAYLEQLATEVNIEHVFVIAGDSPQPQGPYEDALALIRTGQLAQYGVKRVGIAGYPEGHPHIADFKLRQALKDKIRTLAELGHDIEIVTQFAFESDPVLKWLRTIRDDGVTSLVRIGVPGPASLSTLIRFAAQCGVGASAKVIEKYGRSITRLLNTAGPESLIGNLGLGLKPDVHGDVKLHLYPFGGFAKTAEWAHRLITPLFDLGHQST